MSNAVQEGYRRSLERWLRAAREYLYVPPGRADLECYGTGFNGWGAQTHQKAAAAFAVLAADPGFDAAQAGMARHEVLGHALKLWRFALESHIEGAHECTDGTSWGHTWISGLGVERMMHALGVLDGHLTAADHALLRKVLISESDWLLDSYAIVADPVATTGKNKPESNLWNGALLHRTAALYPDAPRAAEYRLKGTRFLVNSISVPSDGASGRLVDGLPIAGLHVGGNFFESFALHHHAYLNVGYMVICLSNVAMLHFFYRARNEQAPEALYLHVAELWALVKACMFTDGRLCRIGGDTRVRYCYCQDFLLPVLLMMRDRYGDGDADTLEKGWLDSVLKEQALNPDGSYLGCRAASLRQGAPLYYTRLESDRAATLSMALLWRRLFADFDASPRRAPAAAPITAWSDAFHGAALHRSERRIASWVWEAAEKPQGLCLPPSASDMAEWQQNLAGEINGLGTWNRNTVLEHQERQFAGGFITWGAIQRVSGGHLEGQKHQDEKIALQRIVFCALPDDTTVVSLQRATTAKRVYVDTVKGLFLRIPNDLFNDCRRRYHAADGVHQLDGVGAAPSELALHSSWVNVDERLGVVALYGGDGLTISRPGRRQIGINGEPQAGGMLYCDDICMPCLTGLRDYASGATIMDIGFVVQSGVSSAVTAATAANGVGVVACGVDPAVRLVRVRGADGKTYALAMNFGQAEAAVNIPAGMFREVCDVLSGERLPPTGHGGFDGVIPPGAPRLFHCD